MSGGTFVQIRKGRYVELPKPNGISYCGRAKMIYRSPHLDPGVKEERLYALFAADFLSHPHNQDLKTKTALMLADIYAVEMIDSLNNGHF